MRIKWCWIVILITACETENYRSNGLEGQWLIDWQYQDLSATGELNLKDDGRADLQITNDESNLIIGQDSRFDYQWSFTSDALVLKRLDNNLKLRYMIQYRTEDIMQLSYADDIRITLHRIR